MTEWNPWIGCCKISEGCRHCYIFQEDMLSFSDHTIIRQTPQLDLPLKRGQNRVYLLTSLDNPIDVCTQSDFFLPEADKWRRYIWDIIHFRKDLTFRITTKRPERLMEVIPRNWGHGYNNVTIICSAENQQTVNERLDLLAELPVAHKELALEPLLEAVDLIPHLSSGYIEKVTVSGEIGKNPRPCNFDWVLQIKEQCAAYQTAFVFRRTGGLFIKDGRLYHLNRSQQWRQAEKAAVNYTPPEPESRPTPYDRILFHLAKSRFHGSIRLPDRYAYFCRERGFNNIRYNAFDIVRKNLAPAYIPNDGRQTPRSGHPVYIAQHATGTCCRKCLYQWHNIYPDKRLSEVEINYIVELIMEWLKRELEQNNA